MRNHNYSKKCYAIIVCVLWLIAFTPAVSADYKIYTVSTPDAWPTGSTQKIFWKIDRRILISWYCNFSYANSSINITLHDKSGNVVAQIASNIDSDCWTWKYRTGDSVMWTVPSNLEKGMYRIMLHTIDGHLTGESRLFPIFTIPSSMKVDPDKVESGASEMDRILAEWYLPPGGQPLYIEAEIRDVVFDEHIWQHNPYEGDAGILGNIDIVLKVKANRPFTFGDPWNTRLSNPAASWFMADLEVTLAGYVAAKRPYVSDYCLWSDCREFQNDPSGRMDYKYVFKPGYELKHTPKIIPEGESIVTLTITGTRLLFFHGVQVVGRAYKWSDWSIPAPDKCIKYFYPELGIKIDLTVRMPIISDEGYGSLGSRQSTLPLFVKFYPHPKATTFIDTFLKGKDLGFLPDWGNTPVTYYWGGDEFTKCDKSYQGELTGGW